MYTRKEWVEFAGRLAKMDYADLVELKNTTNVSADRYKAMVVMDMQERFGPIECGDNLTFGEAAKKELLDKFNTDCQILGMLDNCMRSRIAAIFRT